MEKKMNNEVLKNEKVMPDLLVELRNTEKLVGALMQTKHYAKMGAEGIYAIVQKANSMGIPVMDALNGALYVVSGKIEMTSQMMNRLIRMKGHSITKDARSTNELCILHGKRSDNGDTWTVSFSVSDARKAGLIKPNGVWEKYPAVMCFNRALSTLARQLFPDVIVDTYIEGELSPETGVGLNDPVVQYVSKEELDKLEALLMMDENPADAIQVIKERLQINDLKEIKLDRFEPMMTWLKKRIDDQNAKEIEIVEISDMPLEASVFEKSE
mgnify:CR=1 FL=1|tara:strand:- start:970 stop:1779 length:810 start_codon:yes stop_codon:yes gene_type:complete